MTDIGFIKAKDIYSTDATDHMSMIQVGADEDTLDSLT